LDAVRLFAVVLVLTTEALIPISSSLGMTVELTKRDSRRPNDALVTSVEETISVCVDSWLEPVPV